MNVGDKVTVYLDDNSVFPFQNRQLELKCTLVNMPRDSGDHWFFMYENDVFTLNPLTRVFIGVVAGWRD